MRNQREVLLEKLQDLALPETIVPKFSLQPDEDAPSKVILSIQDGACGYDTPLLHNLFLSLTGVDRLALTGNNGSGKTTLVRAILNDPCITKSGEWILPKPEDIGYLDQHYATLNPDQSVLETIQACTPTWPHSEVRRHLNDFLFRKNEEVMALTSTLSGGEKARLCLAQIAARPPRLLILDEVTNNLDLETRDHMIQVLRHYPGAMIAISHDQDFLKAIGIQDFYDVEKRKDTR
jgi:ATPase subunit of ABC transporter with duplicated ATPase domains